MKKLLLPVVLLVCSAFAFGQTVVDLTEDPSEFGLYDAINDATGPVEIILNPDVVYEIGSRSITYNTIIRTEGPTKAVIKITNNFWLSEGGVVLDSIVFENVHLKGGGYIFNNGNIYSVGKVAFIDCRIESNGGLWRGKAEEGAIGDFIIDNCVIDSIGEYTLLRPQTGNTVDNVLIKNSTVNYVIGLIRASTKINTVTLENVTINQGADSEYWLNTMLIFNQSFDELVFTNVLIGPGLNGPIGGIEDGAETRGNITVTNSYLTSDLEIIEALPLPAEFGVYSGTDVDLWADPTVGDFTIIDNSFDAKFTVGDPRWIPARLSELSVSLGELVPEFDPAVTNYTCTLPGATEAVIVTAIAAHEGATVSGDGLVDVADGSGTANVVVLEGTITQTYTVEFEVAVGVEEQLKDMVKMYYNSFSDEVVIKNLGTEQQLQKVEIFSLTGSMLRSYEIENAAGRMTISTRDLGTGMFLLRGRYSNNGSVMLKFVK